MPRLLAVTILVLLLLSAHALAQSKTREQKVREDKAKVTREGFWIYNDLPLAFERAAATNKPLIVVLRCLPCEECVKLDDELIDNNRELRPLLEQFVRVRVVGTNGLDLSLFQYDTDQSFAVFLLNADKTIYGRFGTRSHRTEWLGDVSLAGLAKALEGALELHRDYPANKNSLAGKRGGEPLFPTPEQFPTLAGKYAATLNYEGNVVQSCIHCHQIGDAARDFYRERGQPIPAAVLFPYPHPKMLGFVFEANQRATLKTVLSNSWAKEAGYQAGDEILQLNGQPLLSIADAQWVLHNVPPQGGELEALVRREGKQLSLQARLESHWRRAGDLSWRSSSWGLRRMTTGGMVLEPVSAEEQTSLGIPREHMALRAKYVGEFGAHKAAKTAGFQLGDILISYDGRENLMRESDIFLYGTSERRVGDQVVVDVLREGKRLTFQLPMQK